MKKKLLILISLVLAALSILSACVKAPSNGETETEEITTSESLATEKDSLLVNNINITEYTVVFDGRASIGTDAAQKYFNSKIKQQYNIKLESKTSEVDGYQIFIGVKGSDTSISAFFDSCEDGMIGFDGYISETYDTDSGELVGYEVRETLSSIVYNTLWLDLDLVSGINSVKFVRNTSDKHDGYYVYLNGSSTEFKTKTVAGTLDLLSNPKALSRRFDIELRTQYFYSYDSTSEKYVKIKASVPMLMVQEENYGTLTSDILEKNSVALSASIATANLNKILADYDAYIDPFIINKDAITAEIIVQYIGGKISFEE